MFKAASFSMVHHSRDTRTSRKQHKLASVQMSCTKIIDPRNFRAFFAHRWSEFLQANYQNAEQVSVIYGVRYQTALNWWQGTNRPSGDVMTHAFLRHGNHLADHMGADQ